MSVSLTIDNYSSLNVKEQSNLDADTTVGSGSLTLVNNQNIVANDYLLIGVPGSETGEILQVASVSGATIATTANTTLKHNRFDPVRTLLGNQLRIYRAPDVNGLQPLDASFALLATIAIDPDQLSTGYTDATGTAAFWYKFTYYNATTPSETNLSDSGAARGGGVGNYVATSDIRDEAGFKNNRNISTAKVDKFRQQAQATINGALSGLYTLPFTAPINPTIERIALLLGAGYLQIDQYGDTYNTDSSGDNRKVAEAMATLEKLKSGQLEIIGTDGGSTANPSSNHGFSGYPNVTTAGDTNGAEDFMFERSDITGYYERQY